MKLIPWRAPNAAQRRAQLPALFDEFFGDANWSPTKLPELFRGEFAPAVNLSESDGEFTATFELPGLDEKDIDVRVVGRTLIVSGERKWENEEKNKRFHRVESEYGVFRREVELPDGLMHEPDAVKATFRRGVLEVTIPKVEPKPTAKIKVVSGK